MNTRTDIRGTPIETEAEQAHRRGLLTGGVTGLIIGAIVGGIIGANMRTPYATQSPTFGTNETTVPAPAPRNPDTGQTAPAERAPNTPGEPATNPPR